MTIQHYVTKHTDAGTSLSLKTGFLELNKNEMAVLPGKVVSNIYLVQSGVMRSFFTDSRGKEITNYVAFPGSLITDLTAFTSGSSGILAVQALEKTCVERIHRNQLDMFLRNIPAFRTLYTRFLESAYRKQNERLADLFSLNARDRYGKLMSEHPEYVLRLPNRILASYLNMSQETLSRIKRL